MLTPEDMYEENAEETRAALIHAGIDPDDEDFLAHYGVPGMKWGQRRREDRAERNAGGGRLATLRNKNGKALVSVARRTSPLESAIKKPVRDFQAGVDAAKRRVSNINPDAPTNFLNKDFKKGLAAAKRRIDNINPDAKTNFLNKDFKKGLAAVKNKKAYDAKVKAAFAKKLSSNPYGDVRSAKTKALGKASIATNLAGIGTALGSLIATSPQAKIGLGAVSLAISAGGFVVDSKEKKSYNEDVLKKYGN